MTNERRAEDALRLNEERMRVALSASTVTISSQDTDLRFTWVYNLHPSFAGKKVLGKTDADPLPEDDVAALVAIERGVLESGVGTHQEVHTTFGGQHQISDMTVEPLRDAADQIVGITSASLQVTDLIHRQREAARREKTRPRVATARQALSRPLSLPQQRARLKLAPRKPERFMGGHFRPVDKRAKTTGVRFQRHPRRPDLFAGF